MSPPLDRDPLTAAVDWQSARRLSYHSVSALASESVGLAESIGRVLARDMVAAQDIPHYASSAMDGWAVSGDPPWMLRLPESRLQPGEAVPILTGGQIPVGTERVVRSEHARTAEGSLHLLEGGNPRRSGSDIRPSGEEARAGDVIVRRGTILNPAHVAVAASCALDLVEVTSRPRVTLILTGDEVVESGRPPAGRVRDSFGPQLPALIAMLGGAVVDRQRVPDLLAATIAAIDASESELVITTGGTGSSSADHVRSALRELGATTLIPRLALRPGGPTLLARLPDGRILLGLAGNPLAAMIGLAVVAAPLLEALTGRALSDAMTVQASRAIPGYAGATSVLPYRDRDGFAVPSEWIGSAMMRGLAESTGLLLVPPSGVDAAAQAEALPLPWPAAR